MLYAIWYHLYNFKKRKKHPWSINTPLWVFSRFLKCVNGTKSRNTSHIILRYIESIKTSSLSRCNEELFPTEGTKLIIHIKFVGRDMNISFSRSVSKTCKKLFALREMKVLYLAFFRDSGKFLWHFPPKYLLSFTPFIHNLVRKGHKL